MESFSQSIGIPVLKQQRTKIDLANEDMKKNWGKAKDRKETTATSIAVNEMVLHRLTPVTRNLMQLVAQYTGLSLAGSCSAQVRSAVRFLEQKYTTMKEGGVGQDELQKVKESLGHMERKLKVFEKVEKDTQRLRSVGIESEV